FPASRSKGSKPLTGRRHGDSSTHNPAIKQSSNQAIQNPAGILKTMQATYVGSYLGILLLVGVAAVVSAAMVTLSWVLGPKKETPYKQSAYECGVAPVGDAKERFPIKFYLVAIVFILFDIEVVFLWSWMTVFKLAN